MYLLERNVAHFADTDLEAWIPLAVAEIAETLKTYNHYTLSGDWKQMDDRERFYSHNGFRISWIVKLYA